MISAYYDDSGFHGDTKALVVCGFVASIDQWLLFERDWKVVLQMPQFDLECLHMKEIRSGKGRFAKFKDNMPLQRDLYERLQTTLRVRAERTFAGSILLDDYDKVNAGYRLKESVGPPLVIAAEFAILKTMTWWERNRSDQPIRLFIDQGIDHYGLLDNRIYSRYGFRLIPADVCKTPPLQGCDLAAWEIHRVLSAMAKGELKEPRNIRGSFRALVDKLNIDRDIGDYENASWFVMDEDEIRRVAQAIGVPKRV